MSFRVRLGTLLTAEMVLMAGLHRLARVDGFGVDWRQPARWFADTPVEDVVAAGVLIVTLGVA